VSLGSVTTDANGSLSAHFLWPAQANELADYHVCGIQSGKGVFYSHNTFAVLASSAPAITATPSTTIAGNTLMVTGSNWVPGPQTVSLIILPCSSLCAQTAVANGQVVTSQDGTFSLQMTLSASAPGGTYYIQAANGKATLSAVSPAIQVTGQGEVGGTPVPGISPTSIATRSSQGGGTGGTTPPTSNTLPALKAGLVAAAVGIGVLAVLIGGGIFVLRARRSGGAGTPKRRQNNPPPLKLERYQPGNTYRKPPEPEWQSPYRANFPAERLTPPAVAGRVRREQDGQEDEPTTGANILEGEARPVPETFQMPPGSFTATIQRSAPEQEMPFGPPVYQGQNSAGRETPEMPPPGQFRERPPDHSPFRPYRPQQPGQINPAPPTNWQDEE
jgi:hypothetical protein